MDSNRYDIFTKLSKNAEKIKEILESKSNSPELAKLDTLFRERNGTFLQLKEIFSIDSVDEQEEKLMQQLIKDNRFILDKMEKIKEEMEAAMNRKEHDAKEISKYSSNNLKG